MSEPTSASDIPENIGRNDPCPCSSGRKYKKCCQKTHRLQKETHKKSQQPHRLVGPSTIPFAFYKVLTQIYENNALGLFYDLSHDEGPFRSHFNEKSAFITAVDAGQTTLAAAPDYDFVHLRIDPPDTVLLLRADDPKKSEVAFEIITLRPNQLDHTGQPRDVEHNGLRIWSIRTVSIDRSELNGAIPPLEAFDIAWNPA